MKKNIKLSYISILTLLPHIILATVLASCQALAVTQTFKIPSASFNEQREIVVSLPPNYHEEAFFNYPVLYLTDASSQLEHSAAMIHYLAGTISPMIIVGINHKQRFSELAPYKADKSRNGMSIKLHQFIVDEVKPFVEGKYRTADFSILSGHSLGGVFALGVYQESPQDFEAYLALTPSMAWGNEVLLTLLAKNFSKAQQPKLFLSFEGQSVFPTPRKSYASIKAMLSENKHLIDSHHIELLEDEDHVSVAHLGSYRALKRLYKGWFLSMPAALSSETAIADHYQGLSNKLGYTVKPTEYELRSLGEAFINRKMAKEAMKVAKLAKQYYPESHYSYSLLASAALALEDKNNFEAYIKRAIALSAHLPNHQQGYQKRLQTL